jgi:hypothetical protein
MSKRSNNKAQPINRDDDEPEEGDGFSNKKKKDEETIKTVNHEA